MQQQMYDMLEASKWVWSHLWEKDTDHVTCDVLDAIQLSTSEIDSWIFTSSDGKVKSKSRPRWHAEIVTDRSRNCDGDVTAHFLLGNKWHAFNPKAPITFEPGVTAIVSLGHLSSYYFVEQSFQKQQGIMAPKTTTIRLCYGNVKGIPAESGAGIGIPEQRIPSLSKALNDTMKNKITELISLLERRSRRHIDKLVCVFAVEDRPQDKARIWLHHATEVITTRKRHTERGFSEKQSTASHLTHASGCGLRKVKCVGDFCNYVEAFESFIENDEEDTDNAYGHSEFRDAIKRNRRPSKEQDIPDPDAEEALRQQQEAIEVATGQANNASPDGLASMVKMKSITLARKEMAELDANRGVTTWPKDLELWYNRVGHNEVRRKLAQIPVSSAHVIGKAMANPDEDITAKTATPTRKVTLTKKSLEQGIATDSSNTIPYDLSDNSYAPAAYSSKTGQLSWYYSDAPVCGRCYKVYKELDRNRDVFLTSELQKKQASDLSRIDAYYATHQQHAARRLAKAKKTRNRRQEEQYEDDSLLHRIAPPPDRVLPLMPWQLKGQEKIAKYSEGKSAFIRNMGGKANQIRELARQEITNDTQDDIALHPDFDWRRMVRDNASRASALKKSQSAGYIDKPRRKKKEKTVVKKQFDSNRLLHSYQRDLAQLRKEVDDIPAVEEKPVYIAKEKHPKKFHLLEAVRKKRPAAVPDDNATDFTSGTLPPLPMHVVKDRLAAMNDKSQPINESAKKPILQPSKSEQSLVTKGAKSGIASVSKTLHSIPSPASHTTAKTPTSPLKQTRFHPSIDSKPPSAVRSDDSEDSDEDDDGIGWSPFTVVT